MDGLIQVVQKGDNMKVKFLMLVCLFPIMCLQLFAQSKITYDIEGKVYLTIPSVYEIQKASEYNMDGNVEYINTYTKKNGEVFIESTTGDKHFVFQQEGLNKHNKDAFEQYSRIVIDYFVELDMPGYVDKIKTDENFFKMTINQLDSGLSVQGMKIEEIIDYGVLSINGFPATKIEYVRSGYNGAKPVHCSLYEIFNKNEGIILCVSYRIEEKDKWQEVEKFIIHSLHFKDIDAIGNVHLNNEDETHFAINKSGTYYLFVALIIGIVFFFLIKKNLGK